MLRTKRSIAQDELDKANGTLLICKGCGDEKPATMFRYEATMASKRARVCRACMKKHEKKTRADNHGRRPTPCSLCAGLPHRVVGVRCKACKLEFVPLDAPRIWAKPIIR